MSDYLKAIDNLRAATTEQELTDAWMAHCDHYADESEERDLLRQVYIEVLSGLPVGAVA